MLQYSTDVS